MDMHINADQVKQIRIQRAWSQEELAAIAGISLRTIQRVENNGTCSLDTRKALAAALESEIGLQEPADTTDKKLLTGTFLGFAGTGLGLLCAYGGIAASVLSGAMEPGEAGIYFGITAAVAGLCASIIGTHSSRLPKS